MVFPGVLRGRPGPRLATILTSRPRRSLSSPRMYCRPSVAGDNEETTRGEQKRRGPGPLEEPVLVRPEGLSSVRPEGRSWRVARPHTSVASLFATRFRVWIQSGSLPWRLQPLSEQHPARCEKNALRRLRGTSSETNVRPSGHGSRAPTLRERLLVLPQWMYG